MSFFIHFWYDLFHFILYNVDNFLKFNLDVMNNFIPLLIYDQSLRSWKQFITLINLFYATDFYLNVVLWLTIL